MDVRDRELLEQVLENAQLAIAHVSGHRDSSAEPTRCATDQAGQDAFVIHSSPSR